MSFPFPSYRFDEVEQAYDEPGIYAWYHEVRLSKADVEKFISTVHQSPIAERTTFVETFLRDRIFAPYKDSPYNINLSGGLKPEYRGQIQHFQRISAHTVESLASRPEGMEEIKNLLRLMVPVFSSPIYIGVATRSLRTRLLQHQKLINEYREMPPSLRPTDDDHSFAYDAVCQRALSPLELIVYVMKTPVSRETQLAAEYIFNRINYPLCGRN